MVNGSHGEKSARSSPSAPNTFVSTAAVSENDYKHFFAEHLEGYDGLVLALGAEPIVPRLPGIDGPNVAWAPDAEAGKAAVGRRIAVIGGSAVGRLGRRLRSCYRSRPCSLIGDRRFCHGGLGVLCCSWCLGASAEGAKAQTVGDFCIA